MIIPKVKIRIAKQEDVNDIVKINRIGWLTTYESEENNVTKADILSKDFNKLRAWKDTIKNEKSTSHFWVAEADGKIIGYSSAQRKDKFNELGLYILPKFQSIGVLLRTFLIKN